MAKTVEIKWTNSVTPGVTHTAIYRDDVLLAKVPITDPSTYDDTTAQDGVTYKYEVQGVIDDRESTDEVQDINTKSITISEGIAIEFTTTSKDAAWVFNIIGNAGGDIEWSVDGGQVQVVSGDVSPVFNLTNAGTTSTIKGTSSSGFAGLHSLYGDLLLIDSADVLAATDLVNLSIKGDYVLTAIDVSTLAKLENLTVRTQTLTALDITNNIALKELYAYTNQLTTIDLGSNPLLELVYLYSNNLTTAALDGVVNSLAGFSVSGGDLRIVGNSGNLTKDSYDGYQELVSRSWTIDVDSPIGLPAVPTGIQLQHTGPAPV